jgi:rRNA processing protein Gar1
MKRHVLFLVVGIVIGAVGVVFFAIRSAQKMKEKILSQALKTTSGKRKLAKAMTKGLKSKKKTKKKFKKGNKA